MEVPQRKRYAKKPIQSVSPNSKIGFVALEEPFELIKPLLLRCKDELASRGVEKHNMQAFFISDSKQFLAAIRQVLEQHEVQACKEPKRFDLDAIICIGCLLPMEEELEVVKEKAISKERAPGFAFYNRCKAITHEVMEASLDFRVPVTWGVVPYSNINLARDKLGLASHEVPFPEELAHRALEMIAFNSQWSSS